MFKPPLCLLFFFLISICAGAPSQADTTKFFVIGPPAEWIRNRPVKPGSELPHVTGGQNFLLLDRQINVAENATYHRRVYQIVNESGRESGSQVYINFDPSYQQLEIHHLRLIRSGETHNRLDPVKVQILQQEREMDRLLYNGERSAFIILDDVRIGDTIDVAYTLSGRNPIFGDKFIDIAPFGWAVPVVAQYLRLLAPPTRSIHSQVQGDVRPAITKAKFNGLNETEWSTQNMPAIDAEESVPSSVVVYPFIELSEFDSWHDVVKWALPLYAIESTSDSLVENEVQRIRDLKLDDKSAIVAALDFVQQEVRYLGIEMGPGSHQPSQPNEVLKRRFGDCKDKARLLATILTKLGFQASPMLVHSSRHDNLHQWLPSPYAFDHVIVSVDLNRTRYYLDPTLTYQRGSTPALRSVGHYGPYLNIRPNTAELEDATLGPADAYTSRIDETFSLTAFDQPAGLTIHTIAQGASANYLRAYFASRSREQLNREYLEYYTHYYSGITHSEPLTIQDDTQNNIIHLTEHYTVHELFRNTGKDGLLLAEFYPASVDSYMRAPNLSRRQHPYSLGYPVETESFTQVALPVDWPTAQSATDVKDSAFSFHQSVDSQGNHLILSYRWQTHADQVEVNRMSEFSGNLNKARALLGYQLTYNPALANPQGITPNWVMVGLAVVVVSLSAAGGVMLIRKQNSMPPLITQPSAAKTADPYAYSSRRHTTATGLGGWLILIIFSLFVRCALLIGLLTSGFRAYFDIHVWKALTTAGTSGYQPHYAWATPFELSLNLSLLLFGITLIVMFFRRSFLFPRAMQILLGASVAVAIYGVISLQLFHNVAAKDQVEIWRNLPQSIVAAAIWIPYFSVSRRVKHTFVR